MNALAGDPGLPALPRGGLLLAAGAALLAGLTGALLLLGVPMDAPGTLAGNHGLLMTLGFLGTLVALERAVALGRAWGYLAPLAAAVGGAALITGAPVPVAAIPLAMGAAVLLQVYAIAAGGHAGLHVAVQAAGAAAWLAAAILLRLGHPVAAVTPLLAGFLVLTVLGERLELAVLVHPRRGARPAFIAAAGLLVAGLIAGIGVPDAGARLAGIGLIALAAWGIRYDIARRTIHRAGVTRFIAACLLAGYGWLAAGGAAWVVAGTAAGSGPGYDAQLHAVFLGFVISMVFGHAPVILPGVLRVQLPWTPVFYVHLVLLNAGLVIRIAGGDVLAISGTWQTGGILNVAAMLLFVAASAGAVIRGRLRARPGRTRPVPATRA